MKPCKDRDGSRSADYRSLRLLLEQAGLLKRQPGYYVRKTGFTVSLWIMAMLLPVMLKNTGLQLLAAAFMAFAFMQVGLLAHDAGHHAVCANRSRNRMLGLLLGNFCLGISNSWWIYEHNRHHRYTNRIDLDPDLANPVVVFVEEHAWSKRGMFRVIARFQAVLFLPLLLFESVSLRVKSIGFLLERKPVSAPIEGVLLAGHFIGYLGFVFSVLDRWEAGWFIVTHQALFGLYAGSVFAVNHMGRPILGGDRAVDFLRHQVLTSRDIMSHPLTDFLYGGANYQIEHHLFPSMARNKLKAAKEIVRAFCAERRIEYRETSVYEGYREVFAALHAIGATLSRKHPGGRVWRRMSR